MSQAKMVQSTFSAGELDPNMVSRIDAGSYYEGAATLRNWQILQTGGLMRRPGSTFLADVGANARLVAFSFSSNENYIFAFGAENLKVYGLDGALHQTITGCPWGTGSVPVDEINWAQYADTMFVVHRNMKPQQVKRTAANTFARSDFAFEGSPPLKQPYYKFAANDVTLTPSGTSGTITVTTSADHWTTDHASNSIIIRYAGKEILLTTRVSATVMNATVRETLSGTGAGTDWDEAAFSEPNGYPSAVVFHENRLWFGGGIGRPAGLYASQSANYFNFDVDDASDSDAINLTVAGITLHEIRHLNSGRHLEIFTDSAEFFIKESTTAVITPANVALRMQTPFGTSRVRPVNYDGATLFVQRGSNTIREFVFSDILTTYQSNSVSLLAHHLIGTPVSTAISLGNDDRPESYLFVLNSDGAIAVYHSLRDEKKQGWALWTTDGQFLSIVSIYERLFALVQRTVNSATKYYLEEIAHTDATSLDCSKTVTSGSPTKTYSGYTHLASQSVNVLSGNYSLGTYTVSAGGVITITEENISSITAGFNYTPTLKTMPVDNQGLNGQTSGEPKRINRVLVNIRDAMAISVDGTALLVRQVNDDFSNQPSTITGTKEFFLLGWQKDPAITITQADPLPLKLLGVSMEVVF